MTTLTLVTISPRQLDLLGALIAHFWKQHAYAQARTKSMDERTRQLRLVDGLWLENIPLQKIYSTFQCNSRDRKVVKFAAAIFFKQKFRGNSLTGKCSGWVPLERPHVNEQLRRLIPELMMTNRQFLADVRAALYSKDGAEVVTRFQFDTSDQAKALVDLIQNLRIEE